MRALLFSLLAACSSTPELMDATSTDDMGDAADFARSASDAALAAADAALPTAAAKVKWHPGVGMYSSVFTCLDNSANGGTNTDAAALKANEIAALRAAPSSVGYYLAVYFWRALENSKGVIDGSKAGSNLDADYALVTGYQSGTRENATYDSPRRMVIMLMHTDYFANGSATGRLMPDWVANDSTYGPAGPDGQHYGYFTTVGDGQNGDTLGKGTVIALWRSSVLAAYEDFVQRLASHVLPDGYTVDTSPYIEGVQLQLEMNDEPSLIDGTMYGAADPTFSEPGYVANLEALGTVAVTAFPHTSVMIPNNFVADAANLEALSEYMATHRIGWAASDTIDYEPLPSSDGTGNYTFGQAIFLGDQPPANGDPYSGTWTTGGPKYVGTSAYFGIGAGFDLRTNGDNLFKMAEAIGYTHFAMAYQTSSTASLSWLGSATSQAQWDGKPGSWGGILDSLYNNKLSNIAYPSSYP